MKRLLFLLALSVSLIASAQYKITINAFVLDKETKKPIPYVNVGFIEKSIGTVSNEDGQFTLSFDEGRISDNEEIQFSILGYKTLKTNATQLYKSLANSNKIYLQPQPFELKGVVINNEKSEKIRLGDTRAIKSTIGYWKDRLALGGEIATLFKVKKKRTKLLDLKFNIVENLSDSLKIRVNVYNYSKRKPAKNILNTSIYHIVSTKKGVETIDLSPYNIRVDDDIIVSIELIEVFGDQIGFAISAKKGKGKSFTRYISQDKWKPHSDFIMNFGMLTSYPVSKSQEQLVREQPDKITVYWDTSLSMQERSLDKELDFLSHYVNKSRVKDIEVIKFNKFIIDTKIFPAKDLKAVKEFLSNSFYNGATDYANIDFEALDSDAVLLFTDGLATMSSLQNAASVPVFCINSKASADHVALQELSFYSDAYYINLDKTTVKENLKHILYETNDDTIYQLPNGQNSSDVEYVYGKVFSGDLMLQGATVKIKNTFKEAKVDEDGLYKIDASFGDKLVVEYLGMLDKEITVSNSKKLDIELEPDGELLEEIIVEAQKKRKKEMVETATIRKDRNMLGYAVNQITAEDINPSFIYLADIIRGRFAGVDVQGFALDATYRVRRSREPAVFVVDGLLFSEPPNFIDVNNIQSITLLKGLAAAIRYGGFASGGLFIIRLKSSMPDFAQKQRDTLLVKNNDYKEQLPFIHDFQIKEDYVRTLENASGFEDAKSVFKTLLNEKENYSVPFMINACDYFMRWDKDFAVAVLSNIEEIADDNVKVLKTLAYKYEALGRLQDAKKVYEEIVLLNPKAAQSYRDLALIYQETGDYIGASNLYKQMISNGIDGVDFSGLSSVIENELKRLIALHRQDIEYRDFPANYRSIKFDHDVLFVFDWNDPGAEFKLQFVSPQKKYYDWDHTVFKNKDGLIDELTKGYNTQEFAIDEAETGEWIFNIEYLDDEALPNPTYLKYTIYKNYGKSNETKEVKLIALYKQKQKATLDKFIYK